MRVFQVSAFFRGHGGGIEVVAEELARHLTGEGVRVTWMAGGSAAERPAPQGLGTVLQAGSIDPLSHRVGLPLPIWGPASLWRMWKEVGDADVVQVHDFMYFPSLAALLMAGLRRRPVALTQHVGGIGFRSPIARGVLGFLNRTIGRVVMRSCSQVIFCGKPVLDYYASFATFRRPPLLVSNGVASATYVPAFDTSARGPQLRCLFVGRFVEKKGLPLLERCAGMPGVTWTFVGDGPLSPGDWKADPAAVRVVSGLRGSEVVPYYHAADLLVLPSTGEGFPLVVQEALACGTPVLVSREVHEAFPRTDHRCVFDVELRGDNAAEALRDRIQELAGQLDSVRTARRAANELARQWSWERCIEQYADVYRRLCGERVARS
jgi:glycosyltransferase involved in cell wall biosynthesis